MGHAAPPPISFGNLFLCLVFVSLYSCKVWAEEWEGCRVCRSWLGFGAHGRHLKGDRTAWEGNGALLTGPHPTALAIQFGSASSCSVHPRFSLIQFCPFRFPPSSIQFASLRCTSLPFTSLRFASVPFSFQFSSIRFSQVQFGSL